MTASAMLSVLQISDPHVKPNIGDTMLGIDTEHFFQQTLQYAHNAHGPFDLILLTGDLAQDPCADSYRRICRHLLGYETRCLCLPGNHDDFGLMKIHLNEGMVGCDKLLPLGNWQIIALNSQIPGSPVGNLAEGELDFLRKTLSAHPERPTLIAVHHHCVASGSPWLDTMQIQNSSEFLSLLKAFGQVKAVTFGHIHQEFSATVNHTAIFAAPACCFQFTPKSTEFSIADTPPGYRIFKLFADGSLQSECYCVPLKMDGLERGSHTY